MYDRLVFTSHFESFLATKVHRLFSRCLDSGSVMSRGWVAVRRDEALRS